MLATIFLLLFLSSIVLLIVGLIKPNVFHKIVKQVPSRKRIAAVFSSLIIFSFIMVGVTAPPIEKNDNSKALQPQQQAVNNKTESASQDTITATENNASSTDPNSPDAVTNNETVETANTSAQPVNQQSNQGENTSTALYAVSNVVDGDTLKVNINGTIETVRLIGMDTPETVDPRKPVQCFGKEASNKAKELLAGKKIRLETDPTQGELDKYSRRLAYIYTEDGTFYNKYMIEQGYAHEYTYEIPYKYQAEFKAAQKSAQENQRGFWSPTSCNGNTTQSASASSSNSAPSPVQPSSPSPATPAPAITTTGKYYTSSFHTSKYYYPASCEEWQTLNKSYLKSFDSLGALLAVYPSRTLSPQCR